MKRTEKLIDAFGELIYILALSDGSIHADELETLKRKLSSHKWGKDIQWSFDYEVEKQNDIDDLYKKVILYCEAHGPDPEYNFLFEVLEDVAKASNGVEDSEKEIMDTFKSDLLQKFRKDIKRLNG